MKPMTIPRLATWLLLAFGGLQVAAAGDPVVRTATGAVRGTAGAVMSFKGVPYAAPPVGALRWRAPRPAPAWRGVRDATHFGNDCIQTPWVVSSGQATSEDCLTLNIWTPRTGREAPLPVIVYLYGGGFIGGTGAYEIYDGSRLAADGAVVVNVNYRVGILGFLAHPMLSRESPDHVSGNYGLRDQIAALQWVRRNIAAFGGDPARVAVAGESAGAESIVALQSSPLTRGLYSRVILQSAPAGRVPTLAEAERAGAKLGADIAELRRRTPEELLVHNFDFAAAGHEPALLSIAFPTPILDGVVVTRQPRLAFAAGAVHAVATLVGHNADEGRMFLPPEPATVAAYAAWVHDKFGSAAADILRLTPAASDAEVPQAVSRVIGDALFNEPARLIARGAAQRDRRTYSYVFSRGVAGKAPPATHSDSIAYLFGTLTAPSFIPHPPPDAWDWALSAALRRAVVRFAATGDPNGEGLPHWAPYDAATDPYLEFGDEIRAGSGFRTAPLDAMERFLSNAP